MGNPGLFAVVVVLSVAFALLGVFCYGRCRRRCAIFKNDPELGAAVQKFELNGGQEICSSWIAAAHGASIPATLRNFEAVLLFLVDSVPGLLNVLVRTKRPEACCNHAPAAGRMNTAAHKRKLKGMFTRVKGASQVLFQLKYADATHDRKMMFDNGWELHMGRGVDFIRRVKGPVSALIQYKARDVGDASINFVYNWSEEVVDYFRVHPGVEECDLVV